MRRWESKKVSREEASGPSLGRVVERSWNRVLPFASSPRVYWPHARDAKRTGKLLRLSAWSAGPRRCTAGLFSVVAPRQGGARRAQEGCPTRDQAKKGPRISRMRETPHRAPGGGAKSLVREGAIVAAILSRSFLPVPTASSVVISTEWKRLRVEAQAGPARFCVRLRGLRALSVEPPGRKGTQSSGITRQAITAATPPARQRQARCPGFRRGVNPSCGALLD